jgi:hypothetical protein
MPAESIPNFPGFLSSHTPPPGVFGAFWGLLGPDVMISKPANSPMSNSWPSSEPFNEIIEGGLVPL